MSAFLKISWQELVQELSADKDLAGELFVEITEAYTSTGRYYHNLSHIVNLLLLEKQYRSFLQDHRVVELAIWYHDFVYDVTRQDNEARSAAIANDHLRKLKVEPEMIETVTRFIIATANHMIGKTDSPDLAYFLDFDMSILAAEPQKYSGYAAAVRKEYSIYPDAAYTEGRIQFLRSTLNKSSIFYTPAFKNLEARARQNMKAELEQLTTHNT